MSNGRRQKNPQSKNARSLIDELKRRRSERDLPKRFLIVCEDEKSAVNYFKAMRRHFGLSATSIDKYEKGKCDFKDIVKSVYNACKRAERLRKPGIDRGELPENQNPCSEVYRLIHEILKHADQETEPGSQPSGPQEPEGAAGSRRGASPDLTGRRGARKRNGRGANASG